MYKEILQKVNFLIYLAILFFTLILQSTIFTYFPLNFIQPDFFLIIVVFLGFRRDILEGGIFVILGSLILESFTSSGRFFMMAVYLYTFLISKIVSKTVVSPDYFATIGIVSALTVVKKIGLLILLGMRGKALNAFHQFLIYLIPALVMQSLLTPFMFFWLGKIDLMTYKDRHAEDEYDLNRY